MFVELSHGNINESDDAHDVVCVLREAAPPVDHILNQFHRHCLMIVFVSV